MPKIVIDTDANAWSFTTTLSGDMQMRIGCALGKEVCRYGNGVLSTYVARS